MWFPRAMMSYSFQSCFLMNLASSPLSPNCSTTFGRWSAPIDGFLAALGQPAAVILPVARARVLVRRIHVGLVAADLPLARAFPTADLDAGVGEARIGHAELGLDFEISGLAAAPNEERVCRGGIFLRRLAGDRAVLDAPEAAIAVPAGERFAVEDRAEPFLRSRGLPCRRQQHAKHRAESELSQTFHRCFSYMSEQGCWG